MEGGLTFIVVVYFHNITEIGRNWSEHFTTRKWISRMGSGSLTPDGIILGSRLGSGTLTPDGMGMGSRLGSGSVPQMV